jgi:flagellum-specific peptidoglycan hydrolase FlgJ
MSQLNQNQQIVYDTCVSEGIDRINALLPGFIVAQFDHESDEGTSDVFKRCNNGFGYKWIGQATAKGACTGSPEGDDFAAYNSLEESTKEICGWIKRRQSYFKDVQTIDDYAAALKRGGFYGDTLSNYTAALRRHYTAIKDGVTTIINQNPEVSIITGITIMSMIGYYIYSIAKMKK